MKICLATSPEMQVHCLTHVKIAFNASILHLVDRVEL